MVAANCSGNTLDFQSLNLVSTCICFISFVFPIELKIFLISAIPAISGLSHQPRAKSTNLMPFFLQEVLKGVCFPASFPTLSTCSSQTCGPTEGSTQILKPQPFRQLVWHYVSFMMLVMMCASSHVCSQVCAGGLQYSDAGEVLLCPWEDANCLVSFFVSLEGQQLEVH